MRGKRRGVRDAAVDRGQPEMGFQGLSENQEEEVLEVLLFSLFSHTETQEVTKGCLRAIVVRMRLWQRRRLDPLQTRLNPVARARGRRELPAWRAESWP